MNNDSLFESKLWNAITALTSGVLTGLFDDALTDTSYELIYDGSQYTLHQHQTEFWKTAGMILAIFFALWVLLSVVVPVVLNYLKRFSYKKIRQTNGKELVKTLDEAKEATLALYPVFFSDGEICPDFRLIRLHVRPLAQTILALHRKFVPHNRRMKRSIPLFFRTAEHDSVLNTSDGVTGYEFAALISLLKTMTIKAVSCGQTDPLLKGDCNELLHYLSDLEQVIPSGWKD